MNALEIDGLAMSFGATPVLTDVTLAVPEHSITAVLGSSGSGKTTMLRLVAGFERPSAGRISLAGRLIDGPGVHVAPERRRLGYVPQDGALFPHLRVSDNVAFGLARRDRGTNRVAELLDLVGLRDLGARYPHELSGGQQQRVALARALAVNPSVVLLDEPFSSLDAALRLSVRIDIARVLRESGTSAVLVTHDQQEALSMADQVAVLRGGTIAQVGPPHDIYAHPVDPAMAAFVGAANLVDAQIDGDIAVTAFGPIAVAKAPDRPSVQGAATVLIRPEQLNLEPGRTGVGLPGRVRESTYHGHESVISIVPETPCGPELIRARSSGAETYLEGEAVTVTVTGVAPAWPRLG